MFPTVTFPRFALPGFGLREPAVVPVPESGMLSAELDASETMLNVPLAAPVLAGAKVALKVTL